MAGGGKIGPEAVARIRSEICRNFINEYASTEAGAVAMGSSTSIGDIRDAVGFVLPWAEVEIVDESGQVLPPSSEGLIRYRTPRLMENLKVASDNLPSVRDQWFYPGDIGSLTAEGVLCVTGRSSDVINRGGHKVRGRQRTGRHRGNQTAAPRPPRRRNRAG
jgi:acyl-coenzyme A synthetase/AMP-(fatty) acid ligase